MTEYLIQKGKYSLPEESKPIQPLTQPVYDTPIVSAKKEKFGAGLKKGFFDTKPKAKATPKVAEIPTIKANKIKQEPLVIPEVQEAMQYLNQNTEAWLTPKLLEQFANNPNLAKGLVNPRLMNAVEELKKDPQLAKTKYRYDTEVQEFYIEFSKIMAGHFGSLAQQNPI